ncbi:MAG: IS630 transposase-related protein [Bacteroidia bacterium]|nr:IS630 transposase-related protein [Bacteroidia bacterium]
MRQQKWRKKEYYSETFKTEVVKQIESGKLSVLEASRQYAIGGSMTVYRWVKKYGTKSTEMKRSEKKEKPEEVMAAELRARELSAEVAALKRLLEFERLRSESYLQMIKLAEEKFQIPIEKKSGAKRSKG